MGFAWRVPKVKSTVVRAGFGMNYTVGEYATFATTMAHQPPFTNEQTNQEAQGNSASSACALTGTCFTLANGFPAPDTVGNYALNPHYGLPYVMAWNLDIQKTLPLGIVMNLGYNGARSNHLDVKLAPRALPSSPGTDPTGLVFNYDEAEAFYKMNQATVRANKRLLQRRCPGRQLPIRPRHRRRQLGQWQLRFSVVQDWQNVAAQEGHSGLDIRHRVSGTYLFELPFGPDKLWVTTGVELSHPGGFLRLRQLQLRHRRGSRLVLSQHRRVLNAETRPACGPISPAFRHRRRRLIAPVVQHRGLLAALRNPGILQLLRQRPAQFH